MALMLLEPSGEAVHAVESNLWVATKEEQFPNEPVYLESHIPSFGVGRAPTVQAVVVEPFGVFTQKEEVAGLLQAWPASM